MADILVPIKQEPVDVADSEWERKVSCATLANDGKSKFSGALLTTNDGDQICQIKEEPTEDVSMLDHDGPSSSSDCPFPVALYFHQSIPKRENIAVSRNGDEREMFDQKSRSTVEWPENIGRPTNTSVDSLKNPEKLPRICDGETAQGSLQTADIDRGTAQGSLQTADIKFSEKKTLKCTSCEFTSTVPSKLARHVRRKHTGEKPFVCTYCDYMSVDRFSLERHVRRHTGYKPFVCTLCGYRSIDKYGLKRHQTIHSAEKLYKCSECDYSAALNRNLTKHKRIHSREKPFQCSLCDYRAVSNKYLLNHLKTHAEEKPYKCPECEYETRYKLNLHRHVQTHSEEKPFKCSHCDNRYAAKCSLVRHIKKHSLETPYKGSSYDNINSSDGSERQTTETQYECPECSFTCSQLDHFNEHQSIHSEGSLCVNRDAYDRNDGQITEPQSKSHISSFTYSQLDNFNEDKKMNIEQKPFTCSHCQVICQTYDELRNHMAKSIFCTFAQK